MKTDQTGMSLSVGAQVILLVLTCCGSLYKWLNCITSESGAMEDQLSVCFIITLLVRQCTVS